ncbi:amidohydrolase family protein [Isoptericola cucumis]|uniref:Amidohydrolase n=1 Tax=Isoptericola cucumis TaxID=1776856 RepID=A0ABQ2BA22_9MICO|nr:amidohydrolase family protein [Isoptericola cucumis]GGI11614.1 amidohydrolase [Isoptericola cucumis]
MPDVVVDAHHHLWVRDRTPQPWVDPATMAAIDADFTPADLRAAATGVDATVVVQTVSRWAETVDLLATATSAEGRAAGIAGVVGWADLFAPDLADRLAALRAGPGGERLVGVRTMVQDETDPAYLDRPDVRAGIAAVGAAGLPFDLVVRDHQLASCARLASALPDVTFVLDHLGKPPVATAMSGGTPGGASGDPSALDAWRRDLADLAARPNVVAKLSGLVTEADWDRWTVADLRPVADHALDVFGPGRLMFGSDWPVCLLASRYDRWLDAARELVAGLTGDERAAVLAGTATRTYRLEPGPSTSRPVPATAPATTPAHQEDPL